jgi:hypothetical protein
LLLLAGTIVMSACGEPLEEHPPLYPVKGKVTRDGAPMAGGTIIFEYAGGEGADAPKGTAGGPFRATAKIKDGAFSMIGYAGAEGMPAGRYKVGISALQGRSEAGILGRELVLPKRGKATAPPDGYADPKTSGLTAEITRDGPNEPVFNLKDKAPSISGAPGAGRRN